MTCGYPLVLPSVNQTAPVTWRLRAALDGHVVVDATIPVLIDADERRENVSERELLTDTAAIHERAEAGQLRGQAVFVLER